MEGCFNEKKKRPSSSLRGRPSREGPEQGPPQLGSRSWSVRTSCACARISFGSTRRRLQRAVRCERPKPSEEEKRATTSDCDNRSRTRSGLPFFRVSSLSLIHFPPPVRHRITLLLGIICHCSGFGIAAGCRTTTPPTTDTATAARSSPAEDGSATREDGRHSLARQVAARWPAGCCRDLACCGGCFVCAGLRERQQAGAWPWCLVSGVWCWW